MSEYFKEALSVVPLVAILRGITPEEVIAVGGVLVASGFRIIEVPLTSPDAMRSISMLSDHLGPATIVGAGTVRRVEQLDELVAAGGTLMVTPHADTKLIRAAVDRNLATLPGVATPTEAFAAIDAGADALKVFPTDIIPPSTLAAFRTVIGPDVPLIPTGGIQPETMDRYLEAGASGFGLGTALYRPGDSAAHVQKMARSFVTNLIAAYA